MIVHVAVQIVLNLSLFTFMIDLYEKMSLSQAEQRAMLLLVCVCLLGMH